MMSTKPDKLGGLPVELEAWLSGFKKYGVAKGHNSLFHAFFFAHSPAFRRMSKDIRDMYIHNMRRKLAAESVVDPEFEDLFDNGTKGVAAFLKALGDSSKACGEEIWALLEDKFKVNIVIVYKAEGAYKTYCGHVHDALPHHKILLMLKLGANHYEPLVVPGNDIVHVTAAFGTGDSRMGPIIRRLKLDIQHGGADDNAEDAAEDAAEDRADEYEELLAEREANVPTPLPQLHPLPQLRPLPEPLIASPASDYMDSDPYVTYIIPSGDVHFLEEVDVANFISKDAVEFKQYTKDQLTTEVFELTKNKRSVAGFQAMYGPFNGIQVPEISTGGDINERAIHRIQHTGDLRQPFFKPIVSTTRRVFDFKGFFKNIEASVNSYNTKRADLYEAQRPWTSHDDEYTVKNTVEAIDDGTGLKLMGAVGYWTPTTKTVVYKGDRVRINALHMSSQSSQESQATFDLQQYINSAKALKSGDRVTVCFNDAFVTKDGTLLPRIDGTVERNDGSIIEVTLDTVARRADDAVASETFSCPIQPGCAAFVHPKNAYCFHKGSVNVDVIVFDKANGGLEETLKWVLPTFSEYVYAARSDLAGVDSMNAARRVLPFDFSEVHLAYVRPLKDLIERAAREALVSKGLSRSAHTVPFAPHRRSRIPIPSLFKGAAAFDHITATYPDLVGITKDHLRDAKFEIDFGLFVKSARDHGHHLILKQHQERVQPRLTPAVIDDLVQKQAALDAIVNAPLPPNPLLVQVSSLPLAHNAERNQGIFIAELEGKYGVFDSILYKRVFDEWVKIAPIKNGVVDAAILYSQYLPRVPDTIDLLDVHAAKDAIAYLKAVNDQRVALGQVVMLQEWANNPDAASIDLEAHLQTLETALKGAAFPVYTGLAPTYEVHHHGYDGDEESELVVDFTENAGIFEDAVGTGKIGDRDAKEFDAGSPTMSTSAIADIATKFGVVIEERYMTIASENIALQLKKRNAGRKKPMNADQELKFMEETQLREALFIIMVQIQRSMPVFDGVSAASFETRDLAEFVAQDIDAMTIIKTHTAFIENRPRLAKAIAASIAKVDTRNTSVWSGFRPPMSTQSVADRTSAKGYVAGLYADTAKETPIFTFANKRPFIKNMCCVRPLDASYQYIKPLTAPRRPKGDKDFFIDCNVPKSAVLVDYGTMAAKATHGQFKTLATKASSDSEQAVYPPLFDKDHVFKTDDVFELSEQTSLLFDALFDTENTEISEMRVRLLQVQPADMRSACAGTEAFMRNGWRDVGLMLFGRNADMPDELVEIKERLFKYMGGKKAMWSQHVTTIIGQATQTAEAIGNGSLQDRLIRCNYVVMKTMLILAWSVEASTFMCDDNQIYIQQLGDKLTPLILYLMRQWDDRVKAAFVNSEDYAERVAMHREKAKNDVIAIQNKLSNDEIRLQRELRSRGIS